MTVSVEPDIFREAMRRTASGVAVITTQGSAGRAGITVSTFQSFSIAPPSVMVCINTGSRNLVTIETNAVFAANVLAAGQSEMARIFSGPSAQERETCFDGAGWQSLTTGSPALRDALCVFDCRVADIFTFASHRIVIGAVEAIAIGGADPLIYSGRAYRRLEAMQAREQLPAKGEFTVPV